jgi:hypothetical protein
LGQTEDLLSDISAKLDIVLRLLTIDAVKGMEKEQEKIELLDSLGFRPVDIAKLLNKSQDNINKQLNIIRKKREGNPKPKATEPTGLAQSQAEPTGDLQNPTEPTGEQQIRSEQPQAPLSGEKRGEEGKTERSVENE